MAKQWLTGSGVPSTGIGQVTDYYRDTVSNLVYYRENAFTWVVVPAFTPSPDGIGTTWLHGATAPLTAQGSDGDYFYEDTHKIVYRKEGATWVAKGSLDFIGIYGVQWGNGLGAPVSNVPLDTLPAGSFYLDVVTSDIYYKGPSMSWELKGQLGDGGGGGGGGGSSVTVEDALNSTSTTNALSANQGKVLNDAKAPLVSPTFTGTVKAPTVINTTDNDEIATTAFVHNITDTIGASISGKANLDSPAFTGTPTAPTPQTEPSLDNSTKLATTAFVNVVANAAVATANAYADGLVVNLWDDRGTFNPSSGAWPTSANGGSGVSGAIQAGDVWTSSGAGTLTGGVTVEVGDVIRALVDLAGNTSTAWAVTQNNIGYTAENSANKATDLSSPNDTKYPTTKAIVDNVLSILLTNYTEAAVNSAVSTSDSSLTAFGKLQKQITDAVANAVSLSALRYVVTTPTISGNAYSVVGTDVSASGNKIIKLTNATTIAVTLPSPNALTPPASIGDSFNIRQGGAGGITITGSTLSGANGTSAIATTITLIAESATSWMVVGG
jgi:hypothetical protein